MFRSVAIRFANRNSMLSLLRQLGKVPSGVSVAHSVFRTITAAPKDASTALLLSDSCIKRLRKICEDGSFLRITVEGGGCSGFQYKFEFDKSMNQDDIVFGPEDARVVVDTISMDYCAGATLDYHEELIRAGFRMLANPKAEQACSCGSSFAIKLD